MLTGGRLPLVGGNLCLDFVNTTGARGRAKPRERLLSYSDALAWGRRARILSAHEQRGSDRLARRRPHAAARWLRRVVEFREQLYAVLLAIATGGRPRASDLRALNVWWRGLADRQSLVLGHDGLEFRLRPPSRPLDGLRWPIAESAISLVTSAEMGGVKKCEECDWLFLDSSKNRSRRFCKTLCGDRARARRYYSRHRSDRRRPV